MTLAQIVADQAEIARLEARVAESAARLKHSRRLLDLCEAVYADEERLHEREKRDLRWLKAGHGKPPR